VVTHQLQVERRTAKARRPKTDALPLDHVDLVTITVFHAVNTINSCNKHKFDKQNRK